ncbi:MFS transporter [Alphaproteobacteria bacterium]|jgi:MFS transporter, UMF1 family|nr:MFS transporter [Alphaproteobacteria bacterium]
MTTTTQKPSRRALWSWALYDFANSAFTTIVITFIFAIYFADVLVCSAEWAGCLSADAEAQMSLAERLGDTRGQALWGYSQTFITLLVAVLAPVFGAIADLGGRRKPWIFTFSMICIVATVGLFFMRPDPMFIIPAILLVAVANAGFELGIVFNSSMLPDLVEKEKVGRWSGLAWGLGYFGGLVSLVVCLVLVLGSDDSTRLGATLSTNLIVAGWFLVFMLPMFFFTPDRPGKGLPVGQAISKGLSSVVGTGRTILRQPNLRLFLFARMIFTDGAITLFSMGATYAAIRHGMSLEQIILFGILLNVTAGAGAMVFGFIDDRIGAKRVIVISLVCLIALGIPGLTTPYWLPDGTATWAFIGFGAALGIFVGPLQSAGRSFMARLAPADQRTEYFGFLALTGKATTFLGPFAVATVTIVTGNMDIGMMPILVFWIVGLIFMLRVKDEVSA